MVISSKESGITFNHKGGGPIKGHMRDHAAAGSILRNQQFKASFQVGMLHNNAFK